MICPDDKEGERTGNSYGINSCTIAFQNYHFDQYWGKSLSAFTSSSSIILLGEEAVPDAVVDSTDDGYIRFQNNYFSVRHTGKANVVFVDGHVKCIAPSVIIAQHLQSQTSDGSDCPL